MGKLGLCLRCYVERGEPVVVDTAHRVRYFTARRAEPLVRASGLEKAYDWLCEGHPPELFWRGYKRYWELHDGLTGD
jgi:hypothetical protein